MTRAAVGGNVLEARPPRFEPSDAARIAADLFGVEGSAVDLGSERDQTFLIDDGAGGGGVLKISNLGERGDVLDLERGAILHVLAVEPELPLARPRGERLTVGGPDGRHFVRLFERRHGQAGGPELADDAVDAYARTHARLNLALRSFFHPAAERDLLWDLRHALRLQSVLPSIADERRRAIVARVLDLFEREVAPRWPRLRAQVVHGDFNLDNVLLGPDDRISGIVDFGDACHTAQVADFAIAVASVLRGRPLDDVFRVARVAIDGYEALIPLEADERAALPVLVAARLAAIVTISAWRVERYPENAAYIQAWDDDSWMLLEAFDELGHERVGRELGAPQPPVSTAVLAERRGRALAPALTPLTYRRPVHAVRGDGVWLFEADGTRLLDAYNNVPVVGHCHPRVTEAVVRQTRALNTHSRYLYEPLVEVAERLVATMPAGSGLDTVMLVNSGSEANDLAWRIAATVTANRHVAVSEHAYHGVSAAVAAFSPEEWPAGYRAQDVVTFDPRRLDLDVSELAATFVDGGFTSDGIVSPPPDAVAKLVRRTHEAGGLFVADEVQAGHGRTGEHMWSFERFGIAPDIVTLGKPMGNGYPVAAVITRRELFERLGEVTRVFSTFGGNPVAARAAVAVLDVIDDEGLVENARRVGAYLRAALKELGQRHDAIGDVRGAGLLVGVELRDAALTERVVDEVRDQAVLVGRTGPRGNVLKIRPPLVFRTAHADRLVGALDQALARRAL